MKKLQTILILLLAVSVLTGCAVSAAMMPEKQPVAKLAQPVVSKEPAAAPTVQKLTAEEAQAIALADAGLTAGEVTGLRVKYEVDNGVPEYEVDFRSGDYEYDYDIHAETGAIRTRDKEYDPVPTAPPATEPAKPAPTEAPKPTPTEPAAQKKLTEEEAKAIALADAGLTAGEVTGLRVKYEVDDGVPEYEVDFRSGDYEYDYDIHAETGAIRTRDKEYEPTAPKATAATEPAKTTTTTQSDRISADKAVSIALARVGLAKADVTRLKVEYDADDGVPQYDVEFRHGRTEYEFEIHAVSGKILDFEKDIDD